MDAAEPVLIFVCEAYHIVDDMEAMEAMEAKCHARPRIWSRSNLPQQKFPRRFSISSLTGPMTAKAVEALSNGNRCGESGAHLAGSASRMAQSAAHYLASRDNCHEMHAIGKVGFALAG